MTQKLYETDSYVQTFAAQVLACTPVQGGFAVVLDQTAFFPEGGGQPCDTGTLGAARVLAVHTDGTTITHTTDAPLTVGGTVEGCIDWPARLDAMQQHTGEHILSGTLHRLFGAENVGFHIGTPYVRMDTSIPLTAAQLAQAEAEANAAVRADTPVRCWVPDPETLAHTEYRSKKALTGAVRLVQFGDIDLCACCGTHVARTGEIGLIKLFSTTHFRGGSRIEMACGGRALAVLNALCAQNRDISVRLSAKPVQTAAAVARLASERTEAQQRAAALEDRLFALLAQDGQTLRFEPPMPPESVRRLADAMVRANEARSAVFAGQDGAWHYAMADPSGDLRGLVKRLNAALQGRGGGKPGFVQGSLAASRTDIEAFFTAESCSMPDPA